MRDGFRSFCIQAAAFEILHSFEPQFQLQHCGAFDGNCIWRSHEATLRVKAQVHSIAPTDKGAQLLLLGHRRLRIVNQVSCSVPLKRS